MFILGRLVVLSFGRLEKPLPPPPLWGGAYRPNAPRKTIVAPSGAEGGAFPSGGEGGAGRGAFPKRLNDQSPKRRNDQSPKRLTCVLAGVLSWLTLATTAQQHFPKTIPPGNYSGICHLQGDRYAVVSDKADGDGFFVFRLSIDGAAQRITQAENLGYRSSGMPNRDMEGICYRPSSNTVFISGEADNEIYEYTLDGKRTGRRLAMPECYKKARRNLGLESLTYDTLTARFFTTTESPLRGDSLLRIQAFDDDLQPAQQYLYRPDAPLSRKYRHGVVELCALGDGRLLVMERQVRVPKMKLDATTVIRIYEVVPAQQTMLQKRLLTEFKTRLTLTSRKFANYEGMCAAPAPPSRTIDPTSRKTIEAPSGAVGGASPLSSTPLLLLVADSQNHYKGVLRDWFLVMVER